MDISSIPYLITIYVLTNGYYSVYTAGLKTGRVPKHDYGNPVRIPDIMLCYNTVVVVVVVIVDAKHSEKTAGDQMRWGGERGGLRWAASEGDYWYKLFSDRACFLLLLLLLQVYASIDEVYYNIIGAR